MGHYVIVKFEAILNEVGLEIYNDVKNTRNWIETAKNLFQYSFLDAASRIVIENSSGFNNLIGPNVFSYWYAIRGTDSKIINVWQVDLEYKDHGERIGKFLQFLLPYMIKEKLTLEVSYETNDWKNNYYTIEPKIMPEPDFSRNFGDATGFNFPS